MRAYTFYSVSTRNLIESQAGPWDMVYYIYMDSHFLYNLNLNLLLQFQRFLGSRRPRDLLTVRFKTFPRPAPLSY